MWRVPNRTLNSASRSRTKQRGVRAAGTRDRPGRRADQRGDAGRHRLELERDVGNRAQDRHDGDQPRQDGALAVARGDEVRDRGDALRLGDAQHLLHQEPEQQGRQGRPEIDRQEVEPLARGQPDAAVEGPGGAVDAERQRVDVGAADQAAALVGPAVAPRGDGEQHAQIEQRDEQRPCRPSSTGSAPRPWPRSGRRSAIMPSQTTNR